MSQAKKSLPPGKSRAERLLAQFHEEAVTSQPLDMQMLRALLPYARPHVVLFVCSLLLMPISALAIVAQQEGAELLARAPLREHRVLASSQHIP